MSSQEKTPLLKKKSKKKSKKKRCSLSGCNRKLDLTCVKCGECGLSFCFQHMNRHSHKCKVDVKQKIMKEIKDSNPKVQEGKFVKI